MISPNAGKDRIFDEFSPKKLIFQIRALLLYILSCWKIIFFVAFLFGLTAGLYSYLKNPTYVAEITFALDEGVSSPAKNDLSALEEEFGMVSSTAGGVFSSVSNIVELIQSRLLIEKTLRSSVRINGKRIVFADFFLDSLDYRDKWIKGYSLSFTGQGDSQTELKKNAILRNIYETLTSQNLTIENKSAGSTIIAVNCTTENELFSKYFLEALLNEVTEYYTETRTQRSKINLQFLQRRADSIKREYNKTLYGRASFMDAHINTSRQIASVARDKQLTDIQILRTSYVELERSLDAAKATLLKNTPLFQFLDKPVLPLKKFNSSMIKNVLIFFLIGSFLTATFIAISKLVTSLLR